MPASTPPLSFRALAQTAANPAAGGYPYQLKGDDLDKNFAFATEDFDTEDFNVTTTQSAGGHTQRKVALTVPVEAGTDNGQFAVWNGTSWAPGPTPPTTGTHVLGAVGGELTWIATEEC